MLAPDHGSHGTTAHGSTMTSQTTLVLDVETIPDRALWSPPDPGTPGAERAFPPVYACRPIVVGVLWLGEDLALRRLATLGEGGDEASILGELAALMAEHRPQLVTWNGRGFDLPVLLLRSFALGLSWPWYYRERDYRYRYSEEGHLDLGDFLADHGAGRMSSLDGAARLIGLPGKAGVDGSQVEGLYNAGDLAAVQRYCLSDVTQTAFLYMRSRLFSGQLARADYRRAVEKLLAELAGDPAVASLIASVDRGKLLGPA